MTTVLSDHVPQNLATPHFCKQLHLDDMQYNNELIRIGQASVGSVVAVIAPSFHQL